MKPKYKRLLTLTFIVLALGGAAGLVLNALSNKVTYFYKPTELKAAVLAPNKIIRLGGYVKNDSVERDPETLALNFIVTDFTNDLRVSYLGVPPNLFREGQGIIAEGTLDQNQVFQAKTLFAKHDENYKPPQLQDIKDPSLNQ